MKNLAPKIVRQRLLIEGFYIWSNARFFSGIIYTCRKFDEKKAVSFTKKFFRMKVIEKQAF